MYIEAKLHFSGQSAVPAAESASAQRLDAVQSAQRRLVGVVTQLLILEHELAEIRGSLPIASDQCAMEDQSVAMDVPLWLRSRLQQVSVQLLGRAIDQLREATARSEADQRQAFLEALSS